jgi:16S rRNA (cytosine1402-N4)-methyltransferase
VLAPETGHLIVDGTFGRGGHSYALLNAAFCQVIALDRDPEAVAAGKEFSRNWPGRFSIITGRFGSMDQLITGPVDGIALDLGVSSPQLGDSTRGFSFCTDGPLDMRMEKKGLSAADLVNTLPEADLASLIYKFSEERMARKIAAAIVASRKRFPISRTLELANIVRQVVRQRRGDTDPATKTFQALRIAVNSELDELGRGLSAAERLLCPGGRLAVITFHSLEDRQVKAFFNYRSTRTGAGTSRHFPQQLSQPFLPTFRLINRHPVTASLVELASNPRARSAHLRSAIRTDAPAWMKSRGQCDQP